MTTKRDYENILYRVKLRGERIARENDCSALITGESLGQVASQTRENMQVTESCAELPLLRPLVGLDKEEITETAIKSGSYDISILPYEDCCVLFSPRHPVLKANVEEAKKIYESLEVDQLIEEADVAACGECSAGALEDNDLGCRIVLSLINCRNQLVCHLLIDGLQVFRKVHRNCGYRIRYCIM